MSKPSVDPPTKTSATPTTISPTPANPLLDVAGLCVDVKSATRQIRLVDNFGLQIGHGERVALVGESGSGKSVTARALLRLDRGLKISGSVRLDGVELLNNSDREMSKIRGSRIGMVFQDPMDSLNPLQTIGAQVSEPLRIRGVRRATALSAARNMLDELGVARAAERMNAYPHEFSGGMRQRVVLAMALVGDPDLLIADEPTTALDVRVQEQVFVLLNEVYERRHLSVLLITHDLGLVAGYAKRVVVMYAGRKVEEAPVGPFFDRTAHPYSRALLQTVPRIDAELGRLSPLPGGPPSPSARPSGCAFHPRCPERIDLCSVEIPALRPAPDAGIAACHLVGAERSGT